MFSRESFFHVTKDGKATICQSVKKNSVDLLEEGVAGLSRLIDISREILRRPKNCNTCEYSETCPTCPPNLEIFREAGRVPSYVCRKFGF